MLDFGCASVRVGAGFFGSVEVSVCRDIRYW
jgi:hypothetical protein